MNRRGFLASCLALAAAPAIIRASSLMRWAPTEAGVLAPQFTLADIDRAVVIVAEDAYRFTGVRDGMAWLAGYPWGKTR